MNKTSLRISITEISNKYDISKKASPDVFFNRHDKLYKHFKLLELFDGQKYHYIPITRKGLKIHIGAYLLETSPEAIQYLIDFLSKKYIIWTKAIFFHCATEVPSLKAETHYHINLNTTAEKFNKQLSAKTRYNIHWYPKKIVQDHGQFKIKTFKNEQITDQIIEDYFNLKRQKISSAYNKLSPKEYIKKFNITEIQQLVINDDIASMVLLSSVNNIDFYLENITYNTFYSKYSPGSILYHSMIIDLIARGGGNLYLGGGILDYKKRFNGIVTTTYSGTISRFSMLIKSLNKKFKTNT